MKSLSIYKSTEEDKKTKKPIMLEKEGKNIESESVSYGAGGFKKLFIRLLNAGE